MHGVPQLMGDHRFDFLFIQQLEDPAGQDDAGVIRYVSAEGTEASIMEAVNIVQDTYEL